MRKMFFLVLLAVFLLSASETLLAQRGRAQAQTLEVRLASPLPRESPWGRTLDRIAAEWNRITNGEVRLNVFHNGVYGGEEVMHISLSGNSINAALFTSFGLNYIDPSIITVSAPFLIRDLDEMAIVMNEVQADLENRLIDKGFYMVAWSMSGFVNFFSRDPILVPDDLRRIRIASNAEASEMNRIFSAMGFQIEETEWSDVGTKLNTGIISAIYNNPAATAAMQLHTSTPLRNMLTVNIAPVIGGIVVNQITWQRIGALNPRYQRQLMDATRNIARDFDSTLPREINNAVQTMSRAGLTVNQPNREQEMLWFSEFERAMPQLVGTAFDRNLYQRINNILVSYRAGR